MLIELLVVLAVIALVAMFGIRQVTRARMAVREELALNHLRTIAAACALYQRATQHVPVDLTALGPSGGEPPYLDEQLAQPSLTLQGYRISYARTDATSFTLHADPVRHGVTGRRHFVTDERREVHTTELNRPAELNDPVAAVFEWVTRRGPA